MKRDKIRMNLARASKCNQRVKNGKKVNVKIQSMQNQLEELNKQIKAENIQSDESMQNSSVIGLSQKKCQQINKVEIQADEKNSLEGITSLSSSPSETGSEVDSGIFSLRGKNLSKTIPPYENFKRKMDSLIQTE